MWPEERESLIAMYRRAFWDDPVSEFLLPDEMRRARPMPQASQSTPLPHGGLPLWTLIRQPIA